MANRPINITGCDVNTGALSLSDHGNTTVDPGDTVSWHVQQGSGVASITAITDYPPPSIDVFNPDPTQSNGQNWQGGVSPSIPRGSQETYSITWTDASGNQHRFDPIIRVNS